MMKHRLPRPGLFFAAVALLLAAWLGGAWWWEIIHNNNRLIGGVLLRSQDMPALLLGIGALLLLSPFAGGGGQGQAGAWSRDPRLVAALLLGATLFCWTMSHFWFAGYALSRDEEVAQFAAAYLREGMIARPIPAEWIAYRRAIMPEFFSPFGADRYWAAAYLPVNSAIRACFSALGDAALTGPALMLAGLIALWRIALRLFPQRPDAVAVALLMALVSPQLLVTAMTPYAMTAHFALNLVWLALVLKDRRWSHAAAGVVVLLLAGVHQWHFPLIFLAPFLLWFALQRRWRVLAFHAATMALAVILWAKLWPAFLQDMLGAPADVLPAAGVGHKIGSLIDRLDKWHPLLHLSRFLAWNNLLLVPLALVAIVRMDWRKALRGETPVLPLALGCVGASLLAIDQGYGWGYRYLHGYIGPLALLAGYGWVALGWKSLRPIWLSLLIVLLTGSFLAQRARDQVLPYAKAHQLIHASTADVVLVDPRGGRFVTDLVRGQDGNPLGPPVVMNLAMLTQDRLDRLCDRYPIEIFDQTHFLPLGVPPVAWRSAHIAALRAQMLERGCGRLMAAPR